ncbi:MAG: hypothetical protein ACOCZ2_04660 [Thermodesulfobacteriota bacterium]
MRARSIFVFALLAFLLAFLPAQAGGKDLKGKMGVGFNTQFTTQDNMDGISVKAWPTNTPVGIQGVAGWQLGDHDDEVTVAGKAIYPIKQEENMQIYVGGGMGLSYIDYENRDDDDLAVCIIPTAGVEYFFQGLPNLAFSSELSGKIFFSDEGDEFKSTANSGTSVTVGIHYYFPWF